jgi:hypothetical protein
MTSFSDPDVAQAFKVYPLPVREKLLALRELIFSVAKRIPQIGVLEETLKWGQPSYLTTATKSGSTIRLDALKSIEGGYAMYFHCQTTLIETFKQQFGTKFRYKGNRALLFSASAVVPKAELSECIATALTYHLNKRPQRTPIGLRINLEKRS